MFLHNSHMWIILNVKLSVVYSSSSSSSSISSSNNTNIGLCIFALQ